MSRHSQLPRDFAHSAAYPLFAFDPVQDLAWVLGFGPEDYRQAVFLDQRALGHRKVHGWQCPRAELESLLPAAHISAIPTRWLFHIGHCGSTLVSRTLDLLPGVLGLREPLPLLALAQGRHDPVTWQWFAPTTRLLARGFPDTQAVMVKPTSLVTVLAKPLLETGTGQACLLWVDLQTWLATMLRDDGLRISMLASESTRMTGERIWPVASSDGQRLARIWLDQQWHWLSLASNPVFASRLMDVDFSELLIDFSTGAARLATHYGLEVPKQWHDIIADSGLLGRYAKDDRQAFDARLRQQELASARQRHADEIQAGIDWAENALPTISGGHLAQRLRPT